MSQLVLIALLGAVVCVSGQFGQFGQTAFGQSAFGGHSFGGNPFSQQQAQSSASEQRLEVDVKKHQPCRPQSRAYSTSRSRKAWNWVEKIRFPSNKFSRLVPDPYQQGCYSIRGDIQVNAPISNRAQIYLMIHYTVNPREGPERCTGYDANGCGGWGSCLYCDACRALQEGKQRLQAVSLTKQGRQVNCYQDLPPGIHRDVHLNFCMPTKSQFLQNQGWTEQTWNEVVGQNNRDIGVFLTITVFDEPQNQKLAMQRSQEAEYRQRTFIGPRQKIPMDVQRNWYFYKEVVAQNTGFVGCHRIYGNLRIKQ